MFAWSHGREDELRRVVFEAGRRLREYRVPLYVIESDDEDAVRAIFHRVNTAGKPLSWTTVHDALYGHKSGPPSTLGALASQLEELGMGALDEETQLLPCLVAMRGLDVTRPSGEHLQRDATVLDGAVAEAVPVLRRVLGFLRVDAEIPHLRLLPSSAPLVVLARLFTLHPEPNERCTTLLVRWVWRWFLSRDTGEHIRDERALKRRGIAEIDDDLEASVQRLLELVRHDPPANFVALTADITYEGVALLAARIVGDDAYHEVLRRLVFMVASGNNDAHMKNWSIIYPDGIEAQLSPLYDQVFTAQWPAFSVQMALELGGTKEFAAVTLARFRELARRVGQPPAGAEAIVAEALEQIAASWTEVRDAPAVTDAYRAALRRHWEKVPLLQPYASRL